MVYIIFFIKLFFMHFIPFSGGYEAVEILFNIENNFLCKVDVALISQTHLVSNIPFSDPSYIILLE